MRGSPYSYSAEALLQSSKQSACTLQLATSYAYSRLFLSPYSPFDPRQLSIPLKICLLDFRANIAAYTIPVEQPMIRSTKLSLIWLRTPIPTIGTLSLSTRSCLRSFVRSTCSRLFYLPPDSTLFHFDSLSPIYLFYNPLSPILSLLVTSSSVLLFEFSANRTRLFQTLDSLPTAMSLLALLLVLRP